MADVVIDVDSDNLRCGCSPFKCKVFRGKEEVPHVFSVNLTRGIATGYGPTLKRAKNGQDLEKVNTDGVTVKCAHGLVTVKSVGEARQ